MLAQQAGSLRDLIGQFQLTQREPSAGATPPEARPRGNQKPSFPADAKTAAGGRPQDSQTQRRLGATLQNGDAALAGGFEEF
jgi:hypothetical protein